MTWTASKEALEAFDDGLGGFRPERHVTLGNHEDRIWSFTNRTPEVAELLTENLHTIPPTGAGPIRPSDNCTSSAGRASFILR